MSTLFKTLSLVSLTYLIFCTFSCHEETVIETDVCSTKAFYRSIAVCYVGEGAAAVQLESNDEYIILANFFDFVEEGTVEYDDVIYIEHGDLDYSTFVPEASCGGNIVAPVASLTCATVE